MAGKIDKALQQLLKQSIKIMKLWENASPTSAFAAQKVKINLGGYDIIGVIFRYDVSLNRQMASFALPLSSGQGQLTLGQGGSPYMAHYYRSYTLTESSVDFKAGFTAYPSKSETSNSYAAIPLEIYGVKLIGGGS